MFGRQIFIAKIKIPLTAKILLDGLCGHRGIRFSSNLSASCEHPKYRRLPNFGLRSVYCDVSITCQIILLITFLRVFVVQKMSESSGFLAVIQRIFSENFQLESRN